MAYTQTEQSNLDTLRQMLKESTFRKHGYATQILEGIFNAPTEIDNPGYDDGADIETPAAAPASQEAPQAQSEGGIPDMKPIFARIRTEIIKGIAMLASFPESAEYDALKKILTLIDKPITTDIPMEKNA